MVLAVNGFIHFNHYCLLWQYDNIYVSDYKKCKSIELFYIVYISSLYANISAGAFSGQER